VRPLDPRLLREVAPARRWVLLSAGLGALTGALVVAQAVLVADVVVRVLAVAGTRHAPPTTQLAALVVVVALRAAVAWAQQRYGDRAATAVIADLRLRVLTHAVALGPDALHGERRVAVTALVTDGLERLRPYLAQYLPQLLLTAALTPALLVVVATRDPVSGAVIAGTLPLVPLFMVLVGRLTQQSSSRRLDSLARLGAQVLDLLAGLPTLVLLGRERGPAARVRALGEAHRRTTLATLRTAFLSALVLELLTTLSVAVVAVGVGLRLLSGSLDLRTALIVLLLAPEVYLPLRQVGAQFHASTDGVAAVDRALGLLEQPLPAPGHLPAPDLTGATIELRDVGVQHQGRAGATPAHAVLTLAPGTVVALTGPSGSGKSSLVEVLLRLRSGDTGTVDVVDAAGARTHLADVEAASWQKQVTWLGQHVQVVPGTLRDNAILLSGLVPEEELQAAARACGLADVVAELPDGWATRVGAGGVGISAGQRQRLGLTRTLLGRAPLVLLDEPSAHLDDGAEQAVRATVRQLRAAGRTVLLVAHRPSLALDADHVVVLP
jgi:ATP-binding cassette subfamily C protein CydD